MPADACERSSVATKTSLHSRRHDAKVVLVDAPVEPSDLDAFLAAALDDFEGRLDCCDAFLMIAASGVDEVVLHVDNDEDGLLRVLHDQRSADEEDAIEVEKV